MCARSVSTSPISSVRCHAEEQAEDAHAEDSHAEDSHAKDSHAKDSDAEDPHAKDPDAKDPDAEGPDAEDPDEKVSGAEDRAGVLGGGTASHDTHGLMTSSPSAHL